MGISDFAKVLHQQTGLTLSHKEIMKLYVYYLDEDTNEVDYKRLYLDLKQGIKELGDFTFGSYQSGSNIVRKSKGAAPALTYEEIVKAMHDRIESKLDCLVGRDHLKKIYLLLSESRSPVVNRNQLKSACHHRLSLFFRDQDIEEVFKKLDRDNEGIITIRLLIADILKRDKKHEVTLNFQDKHGATVREAIDSNANENARITYDNKYVNLDAPNPAKCRKYTISDLENIILDKITERCTLSDNMAKTALKLFGDGGHHAGDIKISRDQCRYTFWKKLRLNVAERDVDLFFRKYQQKNADFIYMSHMMKGIIQSIGQNEPLLEDTNHLDAADQVKVSLKLHADANLDVFFQSLRKHVNDMVNRESRAPHIILHGVSKMTPLQAKAYMLNKLRFDVDSFFRPEIVAAVIKKYSSPNGLVDVKRIFLEALSIKDDPGDSDNVLAHRSLLNGAMVSVDKMPGSLKQSRMSPADVERLLCSKCNERLRNDHPHASLHRMFKSDESEQNGVITRKTMHKVLNLFDIIMDPRDFDTFFASHDRGDGVIDVQGFLKKLLPPDDINANPFVPKDPKDAQTESQLSSVLRTVTGKQRDIGYLNGIQCTRLEHDFMEKITGHPSAAAIAKAKHIAYISGDEQQSLSQQQQQQQQGEVGRPRSATATNTKNQLSAEQVPSASFTVESTPSSQSQQQQQQQATVAAMADTHAHTYGHYDNGRSAKSTPVISPPRAETPPTVSTTTTASQSKPKQPSQQEQQQEQQQQQQQYRYVNPILLALQKKSAAAAKRSHYGGSSSPRPGSSATSTSSTNSYHKIRSVRYNGGRGGCGGGAVKTKIKKGGQKNPHSSLVRYVVEGHEGDELDPNNMSDSHNQHMHVHFQNPDVVEGGNMKTQHQGPPNISAETVAAAAALAMEDVRSSIATGADGRVGGGGGVYHDVLQGSLLNALKDLTSTNGVTISPQSLTNEPQQQQHVNSDPETTTNAPSPLQQPYPLSQGQKEPDTSEFSSATHNIITHIPIKPLSACTNNDNNNKYTNVAPQRNQSQKQQQDVYEDVTTTYSPRRPASASAAVRPAARSNHLFSNSSTSSSNNEPTSSSHHQQQQQQQQQCHDSNGAATATQALLQYRSQQSQMLRELADAYDERNEQDIHALTRRQQQAPIYDDDDEDEDKGVGSVVGGSAEPRTIAKMMTSPSRPASAPSGRSFVSPRTTKKQQQHQQSLRGAFNSQMKSPEQSKFQYKYSVLDPTTTARSELDSARSTGSTSPRPSTTGSRNTRPSTAASRTYREFNTTVNGVTSPLKGSNAAPRFVYTGQPRQMRTDPDSVALRNGYKIAQRHTVTSHAEYGLFVKNLQKTIKKESDLVNKQKETFELQGISVL